MFYLDLLTQIFMMLNVQLGQWFWKYSTEKHFPAPPFQQDENRS